MRVTPSDTSAECRFGLGRQELLGSWIARDLDPFSWIAQSVIDSTSIGYAHIFPGRKNEWEELPVRWILGDLLQNSVSAILEFINIYVENNQMNFIDFSLTDSFYSDTSFPKTVNVTWEYF